MERSTPEARLVDAGWTPPTEQLRTAIERREALRSAIDGLKTRGRADTAPIVAAIQVADRDYVITAVTQHAIGLWLDSVCQRDDTELTAWSFTAEQAMLEAIYDAAPAVLASLAGVESPDAEYLRIEAERSAATSLQLVGMNGQPAPVRLGRVSLFRAMVPR